MIHSKIDTDAIGKGIFVDQLIDDYFNAYNSARLQESCKLLNEKILVKENNFLGVALSGAITPTGLGKSALVSWIHNGWIDYLVATGANLYHDLHYGLNLDLHKSTPFADDNMLKDQNYVRIYDIVFKDTVLLDSDKKLAQILQRPEFQKRMGSAELHYKIGKIVAKIESEKGTEGATILAACYQQGVPIFTSSPGDSTIGLALASLALRGQTAQIDPTIDVNESSAIALHAKQTGKSAVLIFGGGSPKNFILQTFPHLSEILGIEVEGHDYFIQMTDARPDTGGLSGATPQEALTWGKVDPDGIPNSIVAYIDTTIGLPLITSYLLNRCQKRSGKRLYDKRTQLIEQLKKEHQKNYE
ncbi:MAG: homospermidine biosynthesis protein [Nitrospinota bacterium]